MADKTAKKLPAHKNPAMMFKAGQPSANPNGRPKGSRNKLGEAFVQDMLADWQKNGVAVIEAVRVDKPDVYLKVVAGILPKELNLRVGEFDDLSDDDLARELAAIAAQLAATGGKDSARSAEALANIGGAIKSDKVH